MSTLSWSIVALVVLVLVIVIAYNLWQGSRRKEQSSGLGLRKGYFDDNPETLTGEQQERSAGRREGREGREGRGRGRREPVMRGADRNRQVPPELAARPASFDDDGRGRSMDAMAQGGRSGDPAERHPSLALHDEDYIETPFENPAAVRPWSSRDERPEPARRSAPAAGDARAHGLPARDDARAHGLSTHDDGMRAARGSRGDDARRASQDEARRHLHDDARRDAHDETRRTRHDEARRASRDDDGYDAPAPSGRSLPASLRRDGARDGGRDDGRDGRRDASRGAGRDDGQSARPSYVAAPRDGEGADDGHDARRGQRAAFADRDAGWQDIDHATRDHVADVKAHLQVSGGSTHGGPAAHPGAAHAGGHAISRSGAVAADEMGPDIIDDEDGATPAPAPRTADALAGDDSHEGAAYDDSPLPDAPVEHVVTLEPPAPVNTDRLVALASSLRHVGSKPVHIEMERLGGHWAPLSAGDKAVRVRFSLLLANRQGPLNAVELSDFNAAIESLAGKLQAPVNIPDMAPILRNARDLDTLAARLDTQIEVRVELPEAPEASKVSGIVRHLGLSDRGNGRYEAFADSGDSLFALAFNKPRDQIDFVLDVPRTAEQYEAWEGMVACAQSMAQALGGRLVDSAGRGLSVGMIGTVSRQLAHRYAELSQAGLTAGGAAALRVFH